MSQQPENPPLTRKQLRELRNTGATPVITSAPSPAEPAQPAAAPLPRPAAPVIVPAAPVADSAVDLGVSPLTRRQARQQERIRTASVPVITPEVIAAHSASVATQVSVDDEASQAPVADAAVANAATEAPVDETATAALRDLFGMPETAPSEVVPDEPVLEAPEPSMPSAWVPVAADVEPDVVEQTDAATDRVAEPAAAPAAEPAAAPVAEPVQPAPERAIVNPMLGSAVIAGEPALELPPSFDQLLSRPSSGSGGTPNALILPHTGDSPIAGPVSATGDVIVTGMYNLPEGLGSVGHAPGVADGKEVDAVLVDGELPAHSSPTPIAASAAVSTIKSAEDVIRPPAPEKGSRLMITLAITAGVLALALVGVLILAFVTGVL